VTDSLGQYLRRERDVRGMSLDEIADRTRIAVRHLERIEEGCFHELPGEVFVKGYLRSYARAVGLSPEEVLGRYANEQRAEYVQTMPVSMSTVPEERGRRFGLAVALVVFAVLATLAMSFLLRPRTQERPEQLSRRGTLETPSHARA